MAASHAMLRPSSLTRDTLAPIVTTCGHIRCGAMKTVKLRDAKANFSALIEEAARGEPTTITRHGVAVAVLTPIDAARTLYPEAARSFADHLMSFPGDFEFERDRSPPRDVDL